ncbi:hypothetical protein [Pseudomonas aeruginosa]|uniref:hypothetical protein n=1 Tax=Pseudomonas aeruginosa TaxID=287 RepID=UPI001EFB237A|nr:hypothetical protein [Pseudomonas aeruginosa]
MPRFVLLIFALVLASAAHADFYQWKISIPGNPTAFFPSYTAACQYYFDNTSANWLKKVNKLSYKEVQCSVSGTGGITWETKTAILTGDSCPEGTDFNKEIGECKENKCEILAGSLYEKSHQAPISRFINYLGCEIAVSSIDGCIGPAEGQAGATYCKVIGSFTGNWFTSNGSCAFGCDVGPGDGPPPGGDGGTGGDGGSNPPGGDGGSDGGTKPGGGDDGSSGGGGGGDGGGNNPCQGHVGSDCGTTPGGDGSSGGDGDGSGSSGGTGGDGGDGSGGGGLKEPKQGSFDKTIKEYDDAIAKAQKDFQELQGKFESVLASKFDIHLGTGGGSLPCWDFTALGQRYDVCLTQYAQELSVIRYVVLFIAAILAGWIVFYRS